MRLFAGLFRELDQSTATLDKRAALVRYFGTAQPRDAAWALHLLSGGKAAGDSASEDYRKNKYHKPADEFDPAWDASGVVQDLQALYGVGKDLAVADAWPNWYDGNPFKAARDKMMQAK